MACLTVPPAGTSGVTTEYLSPLRPFRTGWRLGEKKAQARMDTDFLDWALADFSGYVAADELYDGPFCILSAVDNRRYKRIRYCWRISFRVREVLFLAQVFHAFLPSKQAY